MAELFQGLLNEAPNPQQQIIDQREFAQGRVMQRIPNQVFQEDPKPPSFNCLQYQPFRLNTQRDAASTFIQDISFPYILPVDGEHNSFCLFRFL